MRKTILLQTALVAAAGLMLADSFGVSVLSLAPSPAWALVGLVATTVAVAFLFFKDAIVWAVDAGAVIHALRLSCLVLWRDLAMKRKALRLPVPVQATGYGPLWAC